MPSFYRDIEVLMTPVGSDYRAVVHLPTIGPQADDWLIESKSGDRYDLLAYQYWNDVSYWRYVPLINNLPVDTLWIPAGITIRLPRDITRAMQALSEANQKRKF